MSSQVQLDNASGKGGKHSQGPVSSLNLEPNPFEQSFASTEKFQQSNIQGSTGIATSGTAINNNGSVETNNVNGGGSSGSNNVGMLLSPPVAASNMLTQKSPYTGVQSPPPLLERPSNLSISQLTSNDRHNNDNNVNINQPGNDASGKRPNLFGSTFSSSFLLSSNMRPNIQSPTALTPGGSKKLPPLMLSPNFLPLNPDDPSNNNGQTTTMTNASTNVNNATNSPNNNTTTTNTNSFNSNASTSVAVASTVHPPPLNNTNSNNYFSYIPRTGLTPNESNIRNGLSPGAVYPLLPSISLGNNGSNTTLTNGGMTPSGTIVMPKDNAVTKNFNVTPSGGLFNTSSGPFTPGISSILNFGGTTTSNVTNPTPIKEEPTDDKLPVKESSKKVVKRKIPTKDNNETASSVTTKKSRKRKVSSDLNDSNITIQNKTTKSDNGPIDIPSAISKPVDVPIMSVPVNNQPSEEHIVDIERDRKRKEFLERNRLAASKFRRRKKEYIKKIEKDLRSLEVEYSEMRGIFDSLCSFNAYKSDASVLTRLKYHLQQNDINKALGEISQLERRIASTGYYQRNGEHVITYEEAQAEEDMDDTTTINIIPQFKEGI